MKKIYIFALLNFCNFICCLSLSTVAPFFPGFALENQISETLVGFIFSVHPLGAALGSIILGKILSQKNRKQFLCSGILIEGIAQLACASLPQITERSTIITVSMCSRFVSGFGSSMFLTPFYAMIPMLFPETVEQKMAIGEFSSSLGYLIGPIFGSLLYSFGGFVAPFVFFGMLSILISFFLPWTLKGLKHINNQLEEATGNPEDALLDAINTLLEDEDSTTDSAVVMPNVSPEQSTQEIKLSYLNVLQSYSITSCFVVCLTISVLYTFYSPTYAQFVQYKYGIQAQNVGYYMATASISYALATVFVSIIRKNKAFFIFFGLLLTAFSQVFIGPDEIMGLPKSKWITVGAQASYGFFGAFPFILTLPFMNEQLLQRYPNQKEQCSVIASALFNAAISFGEFIGPLSAGVLVTAFEFERSATMLGGLLFAACLLFAPVFILKGRSSQIYSS